MSIHTGSQNNTATETSSGLSLLTINSCVCSDPVLTYVCYVPGGTSTVWRGSAFNCTEDAIILYHDWFRFGNATGVCNGHDVHGQGLYEENSTYVSILNVTMNSYLNKKSIECAYSDGSRLIPIGRKTLDSTTLTGK